MFLAQLAVSMLVWAGTVYLLVRMRARLIERFTTVPRGRRAGAAIFALVASVSLLALGMGALAAGGLTPQGLTWWGWPLITLVGAAFVALQSIALVPLALNAVTPHASKPSDKEDSPRS